MKGDIKSRVPLYLPVLLLPLSNAAAIVFCGVACLLGKRFAIRLHTFCAFVLDFDLRDLGGKLRARPKQEKARPAPAGEPEDEDWDEPAEETPRPAPAKPKSAPAKAKKTSPRGYQGKH